MTQLPGETHRRPEVSGPKAMQQIATTVGSFLFLLQNRKAPWLHVHVAIRSQPVLEKYSDALLERIYGL